MIYSYHYLIDLEQILRCENWAREEWEIRSKLSDRVRKIVFLLLVLMIASQILLLKADITRHIAKVVSYSYGRYSYSKTDNNCEHLAKKCVLGFNESEQVENHSIVVGFPILNMFSEKGRSNFTEKHLDLKSRIKKSSEDLDNLTSNYYSEKERIERYIQAAENNHSYTRSKYQIEQEKFQKRIEVIPRIDAEYRSLWN